MLTSDSQCDSDVRRKSGPRTYLFLRWDGALRFFLSSRRRGLTRQVHDAIDWLCLYPKFQLCGGPRKHGTCMSWHVSIVGRPGSRTNILLWLIWCFLLSRDCWCEGTRTWWYIFSISGEKTKEIVGGIGKPVVNWSRLPHPLLSP